jgi:flagellar biosynthesis GTPase FlhF
MWGLEELFAGDPDVFIAGDLFWYPVEGDNRTRRAPDVLVAFGRPKGDRGSYLQWLEGRVAPQVVFEVHSPSDTAQVLTEKRVFYERFGVEEYYEIDPELGRAYGWLRQGGVLIEVPPAAMSGFVSPRLGVTFDQQPVGLVVRRPDGLPLEPVLERFRRGRQAEIDLRLERERAEHAEREREAERERAEAERERAEATDRQRVAERERAEHAEREREAERERAGAAERERDAERLRAEAERLRAEAERLRAERLAELLRRAGLDPDTP